MKELLSRRLAAGIIAGSIALSACGNSEVPTKSLAQNSETPSSTPILTPGETEPVQPEILTGDTFTKSFAHLDGKTSIIIPQEGNASITKTTDELADYASTAWGEDITSATISRNSMHALEFALATAENTGINGTIDMSRIFPF